MGPSELYEDKIAINNFSLTDWIFASKNMANGGYKNTLQTLLSFISEILSQPVRVYSDNAAMLANEDLAINHFAYITETGVLYIYNGPDPSNLNSYTTIAKALSQNRGIIDGSSGALPTSGGSTNGIPQQGDRWMLNPGGTYGGVPYPDKTVIELFGTDYTNIDHWRFY